MTPLEETQRWVLLRLRTFQHVLESANNSLAIYEPTQQVPLSFVRHLLLWDIATVRALVNALDPETNPRLR